MRFPICDPLAIEPLRTFRSRCILHWLDVFQGSPHTRQGTCSTPDRSLDAACMRPSRLEPACRAKQVPSERPEYNPATLHNLYLGSTVPLPACERYTTSRLTGRLPLSSLLAFLTALSTNSTGRPQCSTPSNNILRFIQRRASRDTFALFPPLSFLLCFHAIFIRGLPLQGVQRAEEQRQTLGANPAISVTLSSTPLSKGWKQQTRRPPSQGFSRG